MGIWTGGPPAPPGETGVDFEESEQRTQTCAIGTPRAPIFQQTFDLAPLPDSELVVYPHGIATLDQVIDVRAGAANRTAPVIYIPIPRVPKSDGQAFRLSLEVDATNIRLAVLVDQSVYTVAWLTMSYTKTDGTGCGGQPVSYFETEQSLGINWVDGSPVFQKTFDVGGLLPDDECVELAHEADIVNLIEVWGVIQRAPLLARPIPFSAASAPLGLSADNFDLHVTPTNILLASNADYSAWTGFVTLRYTKS